MKDRTCVGAMKQWMALIVPFRIVIRSIESGRAKSSPGLRTELMAAWVPFART